MGSLTNILQWAYQRRGILALSNGSLLSHMHGTVKFFCTTHNYHILAPFTKKNYKVQSTCWEYWSSPIRVSPRLLQAHNLKSLSLPDRLCVPGAPPAAYLEVPLLLLSLVVSSSTLWSSRLLSFPLLAATLLCTGKIGQSPHKATGGPLRLHFLQPSGPLFHSSAVAARSFHSANGLPSSFSFQSSWLKDWAPV